MDATMVLCSVWEGRLPNPAAMKAEMAHAADTMSVKEVTPSLRRRRNTSSSRKRRRALGRTDWIPDTTV